MRPTITIAAITLLLLSLSSTSVWADPGNDDAPFPWEGEITGMNVYVRSGAGVNWYPCAKMNTGDRVLVLGEKFGWYQIAPPPRAFSYVDKSMVECLADSQTGTIKQDQVYIRAGSELNPRKSATQIVLGKGASVQITGEAEGFYKIVPPRGASMYVTRRYVAAVPERLRTGMVERYMAAAPDADRESKTTVIPAGEKPTKVTAGAPTEETTISPPQIAAKTEPALPDAAKPTDEDGPPIDLDPTIASLHGEAASDNGAAVEKPAPVGNRYDVMLSQLENLLQAELRRPLMSQDLGALVKRYEEIANQEEAYVPAAIATIRIRQLKNRETLLANRTGQLADAEDLATFRTQLGAERMKIMRRRAEAALVKYDLEGELRRSHVFAPEKRRYRLVDPERGTTIAYVDVPPAIQANAEHLIGRVVGIRTSAQQFNQAARVPIAVASSIADLSPRIPSDTVMKQDEVSNAGNMPGPIVKSPEESVVSGDELATPEKPLAAADKDAGANE
ncbi:MAG: hypothetical protein ABII12_08775 [Planctomycetota bacterium]